jgi:protein-export membrane protein SecD
VDPNVLYRLKPAELTGEVVSRAEAVPDPQTGANWSVSIDMNDEGADAWADFTSRLACLRDEGEQIKSQVAIVLDGKVESAAGMRSPAEAGADGGVECGQGITGGETQIDVGDEAGAKELALVLRTGALPITLNQESVQKVSPTLGQDSLRTGITAGIVGLILVMIYMIIYYRALGFVVWLGLAMFTATLYITLAILGETSGLSLSLAGVAGVIISVGVTADSYIVAFERLKDEVKTGKSLRAAVDKGMQRAFKTILVADTVTGGAAIILFFLAVGPVRGFALTLGIATMIDVFIAYFFTRSAVNLLARTRRFTGESFIGMKRALGVHS